MMTTAASPLSPFHLKAASAINGLKNNNTVKIGSEDQPPIKKRRVDTDLKKAAAALTGLSENVAPNPTKRSSLMQAVLGRSASSKVAPMMASSLSHAVPPPVPSSSTAAAHPPPHHHNQHHQPPKMMPNPMGWMWPMVPAAAHSSWPHWPTLPVKKRKAEEHSWTVNDEERLAALESEYKSEQQRKKTTKKKATLDDGQRRKRATWTQAEDERLVSILPQLTGEDNKVNWTTVAEHMPGRDSKQCRDRWLNHLDPNVRKTIFKAWTPEEDRKLVNFIQKHGTRWRLMQMTILPERTELTIKNRWNSSFKRRYTRFLSRRHGVDEKKIQLLNEQGLLHAGIDIEQMLQVAQSKMCEVAYNIGDAKCPDEVLHGTDHGTTKQKVKLIQKDAMDHLPGTAAYVQIAKGCLSDDSVCEDQGVFAVPKLHCFAGMRQLIDKELKIDGDWKFSIPSLGILTSRQEFDLGYMAPLIQSFAGGTGTEQDPLQLLIVEQR